MNLKLSPDFSVKFLKSKHQNVLEVEASKCSWSRGTKSSCGRCLKKFLVEASKSSWGRSIKMFLKSWHQKVHATEASKIYWCRYITNFLKSRPQKVHAAEALKSSRPQKFLKSRYQKVIWNRDIKMIFWKLCQIKLN